MLEAQQKLLSTLYKPVNKEIESLRNEYEKKISDKNILINELLKRIKQLTIELDELQNFTKSSK